MTKKTSDAQIKASRNWKKNNWSKATINSYRRTAKMFNRKYAEIDDLDELQELINLRRKEL